MKKIKNTWMAGCDEKKVIPALYFLAGIMLLSPYLIYGASGNQLPFLIGNEGYYHQRIAAHISAILRIGVDSLSYGGRPYVSNLYHVIIGYGAYVIPLGVLVRGVPLVSGILSLFVMNRILKKTGYSQELRITALFVFILSPGFIDAFGLSTPRSVAFLLAGSAYLLFMYAGKTRLLLSVALMSSLVFFDVSAVVWLIALMWGEYLVKRDRIKERLGATAVVLAVAVSFVLPLYLEFPPGNHVLFQPEVIKRFVTDAGSLHGFGIFALILAFLGYFGLWRENKKHNTFFMALVVLF
ncbi:hypothetical protein COY95_00340, partial [Candidatus Woesearchaeota archaeon CG_4_10_14_0_8_um_filter_47_5]